VNRIYGVLNNRLHDRRYLAGSELTIADIMSYPWTVNWKAQRQNLDEFSYVRRWFDELSARPCVQRGLAVGSTLAQDPAQLPPEEAERRSKLLFNQRALPAPSTGST
jgi:GST-like protein